MTTEPGDGDFLDERQRTGLRKAGDAHVPGEGPMPSFSDVVVAAEVEQMLASMREADREGFGLLLSVFGWLPRPVVAAILRLSSRGHSLPGPIGRSLRMVDIGVKGVVMSLYYADPTESGQIHEAIGWDASIDTDVGDLESAQLRSVEAAELADSTRTDGAGVLEPEPVSTDPNEVTAQFGAARDIEETVASASLQERAAWLESLLAVVLDERERIIDRIQAATGKARTDALVSEVFSVLDHLEYLVEELPALLADEQVETPMALRGKSSRIFYEPLGTVLVISPWNYPFYQALVPISSALAAGNAVVFKPSEYTPMEGLVEELLDRSAVPADAVQVIYGDGDVGRQAIDEEPDFVFFTGSKDTGQAVMRQAAEHLVPVTLELGGKDPLIVFEDATVQRAAAGAVWGAFTNAGQSCTSIEACYVHEAIYDEFKREVLAQTRGLRQQTGGGEAIELGGMTAGFQVDVVREHLEDALDKGATRLTGDWWDDESREIPPTVLEDVTEEMLVGSEETFGPVLPLYAFESRDEVVSRANRTPYGLAASVWSADEAFAESVARDLEVGNVSINNVMITEANPRLPFGGTKQSGFGRYKGAYGLRSFCNVKSVMSEADSGDVEPQWYPYDDRKYALFDSLASNLFASGPVAFVKFALSGLRLERYANRTFEQFRERKGE